MLNDISYKIIKFVIQITWVILLYFIVKRLLEGKKQVRNLDKIANEKERPL